MWVNVLFLFLSCRTALKIRVICNASCFLLLLRHEKFSGSLIKRPATSSSVQKINFFPSPEPSVHLWSSAPVKEKSFEICGTHWRSLDVLSSGCLPVRPIATQWSSSFRAAVNQSSGENSGRKVVFVARPPRLFAFWLTDGVCCRLPFSSNWDLPLSHRSLPTGVVAAALIIYHHVSNIGNIPYAL